VCPLDWPVIVKPCNRDASVGLSQGSVVLDQDHLEAQVALMAENYGLPVLIEEFIPGREIWVGVIELPELEVLPFFEIRYGDAAGTGCWPIMTYDAKWTATSSEFGNIKE